MTLYDVRKVASEVCCKKRTREEILVQRNKKYDFVISMI
ncbi:hypothetical protein FHS61_000041 [Altererythrobacter atlanticus]|uniref:Uncharacterized protein n=1 Tax=Croceibacterium atlanticum TaxID=1267766 RepID=A0A0F7KSM3_9SPHN|nr:hypothetical protein WYH_01227 [Croceibacterium atlanticum]MBB5731048.1 hypothetical protein [Croceibacterium atlanticum]